MNIVGNEVYISMELSAKDMNKVRILAGKVGFDEKNSHNAIVRLKIERFAFRDKNELTHAVNNALDELCSIGKKLVDAL